MSFDKPMSILLIEDNEIEVNEFKGYVQTRNDIKIVKTINSSFKAIEDTKTYMPEGIILDLELHNGEGSGVDFLEEFKKLNLDVKPLIIVTTNVTSDVIYSYIRTLGADFIFNKKQSDYCPEMVINLFISLRDTLKTSKQNNGKIVKTTETQAEYETRIKEKINIELDLVGISNHLKGRKYLFDAIFYLLTNKEDENTTVFNYLANLYKVGNSTVTKNMQTAINYGWKSSAVEDLLEHYKANFNYHTGVPKPTEFIYYYKEKITKLL